MSNKPLTLEEKISREYWTQQREISDCHEDIWRSAPIDHYAAIRQAWHGHKALNKWVSDAIADPQRIEAFYTERYKPLEHLIGWGSTADYMPLVWRQYGYDGRQVPDWYYEAIWKADLAAVLAKPADVRYTVEYISGTTFSYCIWDQANPFYTRWENRVKMESNDPARAESYLRREFEKHKRLHDGGVNCLIHFARTGQAALPCWTPDGQLKIRDASGKIIGEYPRLEK